MRTGRHSNRCAVFWIIMLPNQNLALMSTLKRAKIKICSYVGNVNVSKRTKALFWIHLKWHKHVKPCKCSVSRSQHKYLCCFRRKCTCRLPGCRRSLSLCFHQPGCFLAASLSVVVTFDPSSISSMLAPRVSVVTFCAVGFVSFSWCDISSVVFIFEICIYINTKTYLCGQGCCWEHTATAGLLCILSVSCSCQA